MSKKEIIEIDELIEMISEQLNDAEYKLKRARSPRSKRQTHHVISFFSSLKHHLLELKKIKDEPQIQSND